MTMIVPIYGEFDFRWLKSKFFVLRSFVNRETAKCLFVFSSCLDDPVIFHVILYHAMIIIAPSFPFHYYNGMKLPARTTTNKQSLTWNNVWQCRPIIVVLILTTTRDHNHNSICKLRRKWCYLFGGCGTVRPRCMCARYAVHRTLKKPGICSQKTWIVTGCLYFTLLHKFPQFITT